MRWILLLAACALANLAAANDQPARQPLSNKQIAELAVQHKLLEFNYARGHYQPAREYGTKNVLDFARAVAEAQR